MSERAKPDFSHLVRLSQIDTTPGIPIKASTAYKWKHLNRFPGLFVKLAGAVFLDTEQLQTLMEKGRLR